MRDYYLRVEFQARGAPHFHSLLWLEEETKDEETNLVKSTPLKTMFSLEEDIDTQKANIRKIEEYAENLISATISDVFCNLCQQKTLGKKSESDKTFPSQNECETCEMIRQRASMFNNHICGFSCHKRKKSIIIKSTEGHGILDGKKESEEINHLVCRFNYPLFPTRKTTFIPGKESSLEEEEVNRRKTDLRNIKRYLI